jgi:HAD superfamily hydrolase (TIGR01509 family)
MSVVRAVLFDFNGTLSDDEPIMCGIYEAMFAEHGRPMTAEEYYGQLAGRTEEAIIGSWLAVDGPELQELVAERIARYVTVAGDGATIRPEAREAVRYAAARVPVAVVSGAFRAEIAPALEGAGLGELFSAVVTADDVTHGKPHPEGYERAVRLLGAGREPGDALAFEDTEAGVASAKAAGLRCVGVLGTMGPERLGEADELVEQIDVGLLRRLLG